MNSYIGSLVILAVAGGFYFMCYIFYGDLVRSSGQFKRVTVVEKNLGSDVKPTITVKLERNYLVDVSLDRAEDVHPDAGSVCVHITGRIDKKTAKATLAERADCPLPVSRRLPQSGRVTTTSGSSTKTYRKLGSDISQRPRRVPFPDGGAGVGR